MSPTMYLIVYDIPPAPHANAETIETYYGDFYTIEAAREGWRAVKENEPRADNCRLCAVTEILAPAGDE